MANYSGARRLHDPNDLLKVMDRLETVLPHVGARTAHAMIAEGVRRVLADLNGSLLKTALCLLNELQAEVNTRPTPVDETPARLQEARAVIAELRSHSFSSAPPAPPQVWHPGGARERGGRSQAARCTPGGLRPWLTISR